MAISCKKLIGAAMGVFLVVPAAHALDLGVMADAQYDGTTKKDTTNSFAFGQFDFYATQNIDQKTRAFFEYVLEDGGADVERLWIQREITPAFNIGAGRFHIPLGYWNRHYHHGALMLDTVTRPTFLNFEDEDQAALPMHMIGILASGIVPVGPGQFGYEAGVANSTSIGSGDGGLGVYDEDAPTDQKISVARLRYMYNDLPLETAIFGMHNPVPNAVTKEVVVDQNLVGADYHYDNGRLDSLGEIYYISDEDKATHTGTHNAVAYYIQVGYRVLEDLKPVYRFETINFDSGDPYFGALTTVRQQHRHVFALRWDINASSALKLEVSHTEPLHSAHAPSYTSYILQWAFLML